MKLDQLRYFLETARFQHVGRAGKSLRISPSAISFAVTALEEELGVPLFNRVGNRIVLSEAGQRLKSRSEALFDHVEQIRAEFAGGSAESFVGEMKLGGSHFLAVHVLNGIWTAFQKRHPKLIGEICPGRTGEILKAVLAGTLDFGLCFSPLNHPDLVVRDLLAGKLVPVVRKGHPLSRAAGQTEKSLRALSEYPAIVHKALPGVDLCEDHPELKKWGIHARVTNYFESDDLAVETLLASESWALLPDFVARHYQKKLHVLSLPKSWGATYVVSSVIRKARKDSPVIAALIEDVRERISS
jgi:DNA-binding transcriptional LysR family regulator